MIVRGTFLVGEGLTVICERREKLGDNKWARYVGTEQQKRNMVGRLTY